jgi:ribosomal-protein-alanine N-acetyltransferase
MSGRTDFPISARRPGGCQIRPATSDDLPSILTVERRCYARPWSGNQFRSELEAAHARLDICLCDGQLAGYHCWWLLCGELHVLNLATAPDHRRRGVAAGLLAAAFDQARKAGLERALLEVRAGNAGAIALYRRFGFRVTGRRSRYYPDGEDALLMEWEGQRARDAGRGQAETGDG